VPENVHLVNVAFQDMTSRFSKVIGVPLQNVSYHKLCDFKPFCGLVFNELLRPYSYWGYCDVDLFFGNLTPLYDHAISNEFDFISPYKCTVGHCTLIRNEPHVNELCLKIPDLETKILKSQISFLDEGALSEVAVKEGGYTFCVVGNIVEEWRREKPFLGATALHDGRIDGLDGWFFLHYKDGVIVVFDDELRGHEALYFHFMGMKNRRYWTELPRCDLNRFTFTSFGIAPGLLPPSAKRSAAFYATCLRAHARGSAYRLIRDALPIPLLRTVKDAYKNLKSIRRNAKGKPA
jgi:hypothetical protein